MLEPVVDRPCWSIWSIRRMSRGLNDSRPGSSQRAIVAATMFYNVRQGPYRRNRREDPRSGIVGPGVVAGRIDRSGESSSYGGSARECLRRAGSRNDFGGVEEHICDCGDGVLLVKCRVEALCHRHKEVIAMLSPTKKAALRAAFRQPGLSWRRLQEITGIDRRTIRKYREEIQNGPESATIPIVMESVQTSLDEPFVCVPVPRYYCQGCETYVHLSPCPACIARCTKPK